MNADDSPKASISSRVGLLAGPLLAVLVYSLPSGLVAGMPPSAQATAAIATLMAVWWMTEALPLPATSLLPLILFPLTGVMSFAESAGPYASKYIFLFLGGFMLARAVERWELHRRIALLTVLAAGTHPRRLIAGFMLATAFLSMWISNTASTVMMLPIGTSLIGLVRDRLPGESGDDRNSENFATCMMLGIAYAASIGGIATLVGTPTNVQFAGFAAAQGIVVGFARWMIFAAPLSAIFLVIAWLLLVRVVFPVRLPEIPGGRQLIREELRKLGTVSRGEWTVLVVFGLTAAGWVFREPVAASPWISEHLPIIGQVNDTIIVLIAALALFAIPVDARRGIRALDWETARTIPWGVLLLFGGGFSLAAAVTKSQLAMWIGERVAMLEGVPTLGIVTAVTVMVVFLTELTSNTPTAAALLPILHGAAEGLKMNTLLLLIPTSIGASCAFMLPVATPPNAIVFGSGHVSIRSMVRAGLWLNLIGIGLVATWTLLFAGRVFPPAQ